MAAKAFWLQRKHRAAHSSLGELPCKVGIAAGLLLGVVSIGLSIADFCRNGVSVSLVFLVAQLFFWLAIAAFFAFLLERCRCNELLRHLPEECLPHEDVISNQK